MNSNLRKRLYLGFAVAIFLVIVVGSISFYAFQKQALEGEEVKHSFRVITKMEEAQKLLIDMETGRRGFRSTNDKKFLEPYYRGLESVSYELNELQSLLKDEKEQLQRFRETRLNISDLLAFWKELGEDASKYTREIILDINTREKVRMDRIRDQFTDLANRENDRLVNIERVNNRSIAYAKTALILGIVFILVVVIALINQILREFNNRTRAEQSLQKNYAELSKVNSENEERNWLLSGLASVNNTLQGHHSIIEMTDNVLSVIVRYVDLKAGAFYMFDSETEKFVLKSSVSLPRDMRKEYSLSEGFVGEAGRRTEPLIISNVPPKYATVAGGVLSVDPLNAVYAPLVLDGKVKGVIEVLCMNDIAERVIKFVNIISNNIAVALDSLEARERVVKLLQQVQEQKQILENQQEELRQTNEELTVQAEVLQASEEELRVQEEELRQINAELKTKNDAIETAKESLQSKARELEAASKYKSEFLANMSHELRTPLNSVLILAKLLAENKEHNLTEKQIAHAKIIHKSGSDLLQLINDILDLSKIEAGKVEVYLEEVAIGNLAEDIEQLFRVVAEEKGVNFSVEVDKAVPEKIKADKQKVEQILKNLLSNAIKFTQPGGTVSMKVAETDEGGQAAICMQVTDTGIGIAPAKQRDIFEAFQQADGSTNRKYGGTGLGLSITKELLRMLHGRITVKSEQGKGSVFSIFLPIDASATTTVPEETGKVYIQKEAAVAEQTKIPDDRNKLRKDDKVMLIIEDDEDFAFLMRNFSNSHGYKSIIALTGDEGLHCAKKYKPAAIILDMGLPVLGGEALLRIFKEDPELKHIPVHIISGAEDDKNKSLGALAFLKKPVQKSDLEKAFTLIGEYLQSTVKRVMILSPKEIKNDGLRKLINEKNYDVVFDLTETAEDALEKLKHSKYDCLIADIGSDVEQGIYTLNEIKSSLVDRYIPTIIYLDSDITPDKELALKRIADVVIRKSAGSHHRLLDELELFLYKVQENDTRPLLKQRNSIAANDNLNRKKVLLVDDDMRNIFALSAALEQEHMEILTAHDGKEALEVLHGNKDTDIVLMDVMMPEMDGFEAIQHIRNKMNMHKLPVIALTAKAMAGDKEKCIQAGASDYITKPIDTQKLISLMRVWLS